MLESYNITQTRRRQSWKGRKFKQMRLCADFHARPSKNLLVSWFLFLVSGVSRAFDRHPLPKSTALVGLGPSIKYTYVVGFLCAFVSWYFSVVIDGERSESRSQMPLHLPRMLLPCRSRERGFEWNSEQAFQHCLRVGLEADSAVFWWRNEYIFLVSAFCLQPSWGDRVHSRK